MTDRDEKNGPTEAGGRYRASAGAAGRVRRSSLLVRYGVTSVLLFVILGSVLGHELRDAVQQRVLESVAHEVQAVARLGVQSRFTPREMAGGLSADRVESLEDHFTAALSALDITEVRIWNRQGQLLYSPDRSRIGTVPALTPEVEQALQGHAVATVQDVSTSPDPALRRHGEMLVAYSPLQFGSGRNARVDGATAIAQPYAPIAETIRADVRRLYLLLAGALVLLWTVLFRLVAGASRTVRRQSAENERLALHDGLTGLPNRLLFTDRLTHTIEESERSGDSFAVMLMDLDRFKQVNDTLGHHHGDVLLQEVAGRLRQTVRDADTVARLGGDEFAILLPTVADKTAAEELAERIQAAFERPFDILGASPDIGASLGIAIYPHDAVTHDALIHKADTAMYAAKRGEGDDRRVDAADARHIQR